MLSCDVQLGKNGRTNDERFTNAKKEKMRKVMLKVLSLSDRGSRKNLLIHVLTAEI